MTKEKTDSPDLLNILLCYNNHPSGSSYYRLEMPHDHLMSNYLIKCHAINNPIFINEKIVKDFNLEVVVFSRHVDTKGLTKLIIDNCKSLGLKVVVDLDDYWKLSGKHALTQMYRHMNLTHHITEGIKYADYVTCTTPILADKIKRLNKNVTVLPNGIYTEHEQFKPNPTRSDKMRFGWMGGVCHWEDIVLLRDSFQRLDATKLDYELILGGYNEETNVYKQYEQVFTNNGNNKRYNRILATDVYNYAKGYDFFDVALAPLNDNDFNRSKSELKAIEAGFHKKGLIVSNIPPYSLVCNKDNSFLVDKPKQFYKHIKYAIENPNAVKDKAERLNQDVQRYNLDRINKDRFDFYKQITNFSI